MFCDLHYFGGILIQNANATTIQSWPIATSHLLKKQFLRVNTVKTMDNKYGTKAYFQSTHGIDIIK